MKFQLFRIKVYPLPQGELFVEKKKPPDIIRELIDSKPSTSLWRGYLWHIGNVEWLDANGVHFALGRTTSANVELYDSDAKEFVTDKRETAPHTHVIADIELELFAVAYKPKLSTRTYGIARQLEAIFNRSDITEKYKAFFEISAIKDPEEFIRHLRRAAKITQFGIWFSLPNPVDVDELYIKPMQRLLRVSQGNQGKTSIKGEQLSPDILEKLARSGAASGDNVAASLIMKPDEKPIRRSIKDNPVVFQAKDFDTKEGRAALLTRVRESYLRIRKESENDGHEK